MARVAALVLLVLGLLPIANWIPGGHEAPWYADRLQLWLSGGTIVLGMAVIAGIAVRRYPAIWREGLWARIASRWRGANRRADALIALAAALVYATVSRVVFSARPLHVDEVIQLYQARIFASGHLWLPDAVIPRVHVCDATCSTGLARFMASFRWSDRRAGDRYPAAPRRGWSARSPRASACMSLRDAPNRGGPRRDRARGAVALAFAPFSCLSLRSMMNTSPPLTWLLVAALALAWRLGSDAAAPRASLADGFAFGMAATIRPLDGASFALPAAVWLVVAPAGGEQPTCAPCC